MLNYNLYFSLAKYTIDIIKPAITFNKNRVIFIPKSNSSYEDEYLHTNQNDKEVSIIHKDKSYEQPIKTVNIQFPSRDEIIARILYSLFVNIPLFAIKQLYYSPLPTLLCLYISTFHRKNIWKL